MEFNVFFKEVPSLKTSRLILRPFCRVDMDLYLKWMEDPAIHRFLGGGVRLPEGEKQISSWLNNINGRLLRSKTVLTWCVARKEENRAVGRVDLGGFVKKSMAELSYYFSADDWGKGFASKAVKEVVRFGFGELGLHRIQALVLPENTASLRVLEKNGFQREGLLKKYPFGREFHDAVILAAVCEKNFDKRFGPAE